jgi:hypothetical protein
VLALVIALTTLGTARPQQAPVQSLPATVTAKNIGVDSLTVRALRAEPGKPSLYDLTFVTTDTLASDAEIIITFPRVFDLRPLEIAGSSAINGGFTLKRNGQEVRLRRTGLGDKVPPGRKVSVQLGLIVNPTDWAASPKVEVQIRASAQSANSIKKNPAVQFITPVK